MKRIILALLLTISMIGAWEAAPQRGRVRILAQTGGACGTGVSHCTILNWVASTTQGVTYQVFRGTTSGGESPTPLNSSPIAGTTYTDPVTLTSSAQTFFYEVSATFPAIPQAPTVATAVAH